MPRHARRVRRPAALKATRRLDTIIKGLRRPATRSSTSPQLSGTVSGLPRCVGGRGTELVGPIIAVDGSRLRPVFMVDATDAERKQFADGFLKKYDDARGE